MKTTVASISVLSLCAVAPAQEVIIDQIGPMDGSGIGTNIMASQDFEDAYEQYSVVVADDFTGDGASISMVEMVLGGWNGFVDPSSVAGYTANIYTNADSACASLVGDIASQYVDAADATISADWTGANFLIMMNTSMSSAVGSQYFGVVPANDFATGGQTGCADSLLGDGGAVQANPGGGFGFCVQDASDAAYRMASGEPADPCTLPLPDTCTADVDGDGVVAVADILAVIASWGEVGDGTYRPAGDIAPMPNGDCTVDVADILGVIGGWGEDCRPRGACCASDGVCTDALLLDECTALGGVYLGDDSLCADSSCGAGACCLDASSCLDNVSDWYCEEFGGVFRGVGTDCASISCDASCQAVGCQSPDQAGHGSGGIVGGTSDMNPSAGYRVADTFNPTASGAVSNVCWWGFYIDFGGPADCGIDGPGTGDNFTVEYYLDDAGGSEPGTLLAGPFTVTSSVAPTGEVIPSGIGDLIQYQYSASHKPVNVNAGECYWISIYNNTTESCFWLWETAPPGDERSAQNTGGAWGAADYDVAFCVDIDISSDACGAYVGPCCLADDTCVILSLSECTEAEGVYNGDNLTCADVNDCQPIPGACCFDATNCIDDVTDADCVAFGGTYMGGNTLCADVDCDIQPLPYDQIGAANGDDLNGNITASQIFEEAYVIYDIATLDSFTFDADTTINAIETVVNGWNGYVDTAGITNYTISVYSSYDAAGVDLVGDVYSIDIVAPTFPTWSGDGALVHFDLDPLTLPAGTYWYAVIPWNEFGVNGQTGIAGSSLGDGSAYQANPNEGFGFGPTQATTADAAYRLMTD